VNAPRSWPNSSLSKSAAGIAAQFTLTNVRTRRALRSWIARAISSFPVPVSPRTSTVATVGATVSTCASTARRRALSPADLSEGVLGADLALEVETLLRELLDGDRVGDGHRDLATDGLDDRDRLRREGIGLPMAHGQRAEPAVAHDERDGADRPDARLAQGGRRVGESIPQVAFVEDERPFRAERLAARGAREARPMYLCPSPDLEATA